MAFTNTQRRSASFGVVTSLPDDVIDSLWFIIDHFLKNVFELEEELEFQLLNNKGTIPSIFLASTFRLALILISIILSIRFILLGSLF